MSGELGEKNLGVFTEVDHVKWRRTWRKSKGGAEERTERRQARPRWNQSDVPLCDPVTETAAPLQASATIKESLSQHCGMVTILNLKKISVCPPA